MPDHDRFLWVYFQLAQVSHRKRQFNPRDKFLLLTALEACQAGYLPIANCCQEIIIHHNPKHLLRKHDNFADAMRDDDFMQFLESLEKSFCNREQAEHLLFQSNNECEYDQPKETELAKSILQQMDLGLWEVAL